MIVRFLAWLFLDLRCRLFGHAKPKQTRTGSVVCSWCELAIRQL